MAKKQRIRDPLHNIIEFNTSDQFEGVLWDIIQTPAFQRLRRIRQLGFSEFVYPGATQTRFAHSIGVFHIARSLMQIIERFIKGPSNGTVDTHSMQVALAASLVHDIGHGMFSHAFEEVGKKLSIKMAQHEYVSGLLIEKDEDIKKCFDTLAKSFAEEVADVITKKSDLKIYGAVVSSQFDADRLDYMQRDRLMTGVQNSGIDFSWLLNNLEVATIPSATDDSNVNSDASEKFIFALNSKAFCAAEAYVLSLFHLYPTVYFHKATRGAEKLFSEIILRIIEKVMDNSTKKTGLPDNHPIVLFAKDPEKIENVLALDDTVFWGSLPLLINAEDKIISCLAKSLWERKLFKCIDIKHRIATQLIEQESSIDTSVIDRVFIRAKSHLTDSFFEHNVTQFDDLVFKDASERNPYKALNSSDEFLNQIYIKSEFGKIEDIKSVSSAVDSLRPFSFFRIYHSRKNGKIVKKIDAIIAESIKEEKK